MKDIKSLRNKQQEPVEFKLFGSRSIYRIVAPGTFRIKTNKHVEENLALTQEVKENIRSVFCTETKRQVAKRKKRGEKLEWYDKAIKMKSSI